MKTNQEMVDQVLCDFYGDVYRYGVSRVLKCLGSGKSWLGGDEISVTFQDAWGEWEPGYAMSKPGYFLMVAPWVPDATGNTPSYYLVSYQEFYDKFDADLERYYYPEHPEQRDEIVGLMKELRHSLGLDTARPSSP